MERLTNRYSDGTPFVPNVVLKLTNGMQDVIKKLAEYEDTGLTPIICKTYKEFEDECIRDGVQFKDVLRLKDILNGMTCETYRSHGKCAIESNFNIKYCSDWERKDG